MSERQPRKFTSPYQRLRRHVIDALPSRARWRSLPPAPQTTWVLRRQSLSRELAELRAIVRPVVGRQCRIGSREVLRSPHKT